LDLGTQIEGKLSFPANGVPKPSLGTRGERFGKLGNGEGIQSYLMGRRIFRRKRIGFLWRIAAGIKINGGKKWGPEREIQGPMPVLPASRQVNAGVSP
jgi:hypothetical protein